MRWFLLIILLLPTVVEAESLTIQGLPFTKSYKVKHVKRPKHCTFYLPGEKSAKPTCFLLNKVEERNISILNQNKELIAAKKYLLYYFVQGQVSGVYIVYKNKLWIATITGQTSYVTINFYNPIKGKKYIHESVTNLRLTKPLKSLLYTPRLRKIDATIALTNEIATEYTIIKYLLIEFLTNHYLEKELFLTIKASNIQYLDWISNNSFNSLYKIKDDWNNSLIPRNVVILISSTTDRNIGLAWPAVSCIFPKFSYIYTSLRGQSLHNYMTYTYTLLHEVGHFIGMNHDNSFYEDSIPTIMHPYYFPVTAGFSTNSIGQYKDFAGEGKPGGACFGYLQ